MENTDGIAESIFLNEFYVNLKPEREKDLLYNCIVKDRNLGKNLGKNKTDFIEHYTMYFSVQDTFSLQ